MCGGGGGGGSSNGIVNLSPPINCKILSYFSEKDLGLSLVPYPTLYMEYRFKRALLVTCCMLS